MTSDTALLERPTVPNPVRPSRRWLPDVIGCVVVCLVILVGYHEVAVLEPDLQLVRAGPGQRARWEGVRARDPATACR